MAITKHERALVEALKLSPYINISFEFGDGQTTLRMSNRRFAHDVGIALQTYYLKKSLEEKGGER